MENKLLSNKHVFMYDLQNCKELEYIKSNFCGVVIDLNGMEKYICAEKTICYIGGNIKQIYQFVKNKGFDKIYVVEELSCDYDGDSNEYDVINIGKVPINIHNVGVYFRQFFGSADYFNQISTEHQFQTLTESNKQSNAYRKGIYLSQVEEKKGEYHFNLLRCSTNLEGPTDCFKKTDLQVIDQVDHISGYFFERPSKLNHVLAQIYQNLKIGENVERKAKISQHSDKTKDMPQNGLMAFCTFYKDYNGTFNQSDQNVFTRLRFRLKKCVTNNDLTKLFDIVLYPNSVFIMSLQSNRLYTHEIIPSGLPVDKIPTRMGYVIRCSKTKAVHKDGQTYIVDGDKLVQLERPDKEGCTTLKNNYFKENTSDEIVDYGMVNFSLNEGDYTQPNL
jgi:hypothetical protein